MNFPFKKTALSVSAITALAVLPAYAQDGAFSAAQKDDIGVIVKEYLMDNPNVIFESIEAYRAQQEQLAQRETEEKIVDNIAFLTRAEAPSIGNPNGDITVIEFFDYNCGYCKRALPDIQKVVKADDNLRVVFKEMPILGPTSHVASQWALAAHKQGKYFEFHVAVMEHRGPKDEEQLAKLSKDIGLDVDKMKADIASGDIEKELQKVLSVGREIGVSGTPAFIVGDTFIPGYVGIDGLKDAIKAERAKAQKDG